jgi:hypothetical protein
MTIMIRRRKLFAPSTTWFRLADLALRLADAYLARRERRRR